MHQRTPWTRLILAAIGMIASSLPSSAQGFVEHLEPPVLERGKTTRVTVVGADLGKALDLWSSLPASTIKSTPVGESTSSRAVFDVSVAGDAPIGICGLRLATVDGLGNAVLVLIDDLPVLPAPGDGPAKVKLPVSLWGRFREAAVDRFPIQVTAGQRVSFEAVGNRLGKDVDPLVIIRDAKGRVVAEHDNDPGLYFDCRFEHLFTEGGNYTVEMRDARFHGSEHGLYVLRMGKFPAARVAVPVVVGRNPGRAELRLPELGQTLIDVNVPKDTAGLFFGVLKRPGDDGSAWLPLEAEDGDVAIHWASASTIDDATPARVPGMLCGVLQKPNARQCFRLELAKGQRIQVRAEARAFNSPADLEIAITDAKGKELRRVGESQQKEEILLDFNAGNAGVYGLTVRDVNRDGGPAFVYRLDVRNQQPQFQILAEVEGLTVPRGTYQPVPLTVTRSGFAGKIALTLVGTPPGLTLSPSEIDAGVNAVVCKLIAAADAPLGLQTLQILASPVPVLEGKTESALPAPTLVSTRPLIDRQIVNVDLIPHALREDQRRLPPALTDRLAVQVTPPTPFTLELPEALVTLGRYQHVDFPIAVTRGKGFAGPLTFSARGGQIAGKEEGRTRVYAEFADGRGSIHSKILTNLIKHRVEVTAIGADSGRRIALTRTFDLDIRSAFMVTAEPAALKLEPGAVAKVTLHAGRLKSFDGDVTVQLSPTTGLNLPDKVVIPRGRASVDVEVKVAPNRVFGRENINLSATAVVNGFEEEQRGRFEIEIVNRPVPKK